MSGKKSFNLPGRRHRGLAVASAAIGALLLFSLAAAAQQTPSMQPTPPARTAPQQEPAPAEPGMLESIGRWFQDSFNRLKSDVRDARGTLKDLGGRASSTAKEAADVAKDAAKNAADAAKGAADAAKGAAKDAAETVARLPHARVVDGRERCTIAANGAPDCRAAAEAVCRGKGFGSGTSLDIQSAQKCPARIWFSGRSPESGECPVESFVTRAMCQ